MKENKDVTILAIESSCDETAAAVVRNGREVLSNVISSQIDLHKLYGGVVPEIASRKHIEKIWEEVWRTVFLITYGHSQTYWRIRLIGHIILEITEHILTWPILFNKDSGPLSMHKNFT